MFFKVLFTEQASNASSLIFFLPYCKQQRKLIKIILILLLKITVVRMSLKQLFVSHCLIYILTKSNYKYTMKRKMPCENKQEKLILCTS